MIYRCPVCGGRGLVPSGFYNIGPFGGGSTTAASETCRACGGSGLVHEANYPTGREWEPPKRSEPWTIETYRGEGTA